MADNSDNSGENSQELPTIKEEPEKRGRGRPKGSRDSAPRRTRVIVEQEPEPSEPAAPKARAAPTEPSQPSPPSPRTLFKQASDSMAALQTQKESARRAYWQDTINRTLR